METEAPAAPPSRRPRTWLLVLLAAVVLAAVAMSLGRSAEPPAQTSNPTRQPQQAAGERVDPAALDVGLDKLKEAAPAPDQSDRNPFRFKPKPAPAPAPAPRPLPPMTAVTEPPKDPVPTVPPIPLKFIGYTEVPGVGKIAALTDCKHTVQGKEGETVDGRYRIVKIGVESLMISYLDGKGLTTLRAGAAECVTK